VKLPHDPEHLEHLRGDQRRLLPVPTLERDLRDLLPRTETVVGDATPEAFGMEAVVNAAAEFPGQVGQGLPGRLSMAKSSEAKKVGATQHRPQQRSQSGF